MKKTIISIYLAILAILAVGAFAAPSVQAHDGVASGTCQGGVQWNYHDYNAGEVNSITVTIDGVVRYHDGDFKTSDSGSIATDKTIPHTWDVLVNAPGTQFDRHPAGSYPACVAPPTTTTVAPTTTTTIPATTTTVAETTTTVADVTTTSVVEIITPPVPCAYNPTVPADSPLCVPPAPSTVSDVLVLTAEPQLPATGGSDTVLIGACILFGAGIILLVARGRRVR